MRDRTQLIRPAAVDRWLAGTAFRARVDRWQAYAQAAILGSAVLYVGLESLAAVLTRGPA
jgi:hypothetical protein